MNWEQAKKALGIKAFGIPFCPSCGPGCGSGGDALRLTAQRVVKRVKGPCALDAARLDSRQATDTLTDSYEYGTVLSMTWGDPWLLKGKVVWYNTKTVKGKLVIEWAIVECKYGYALLKGNSVPINVLKKG